jgi:phospholipase D1/2
MQDTPNRAQDRRGRPGGVPAPDAPGGYDDLRVMLTAEEAFPCLEQMFLSAERRIVAGFRIFDPTTQLQSAEARSRFDDWCGLVIDTLARGVQVRLVLSDFDPVAAPDLHRRAHKSARLFQEAAERAGVAQGLEIRVAMHPAEVGPIFRIVFAPLARRYLARTARHLNTLTRAERAEWLTDAVALRGWVAETREGRLRRRRSALPPLRPCTHHQKLAVADGERLFIGGLDLDDRRADGLGHYQSAGQTWHDVALSLSGPVAASAEAHLDRVLDELDGRRTPAPRPGLLRTLARRRRGPARLRLGPKPVAREIYDRTLAEVEGAQQLIYLESQFLRDLRFASALARRAREAPGLGLIVVLPAAPEPAAFLGDSGLSVRFGEHLQARCVERIKTAFGARATFVSPAQPRARPPDGTRAVIHDAPIVYVHAKVSVFDGRAAVVSSANLNGRSHRWDTEAGVALEAPDQAAFLQERLMRHWLPEDAGPELFDPETAPDAWARLADDNAAQRPDERRGFLLPFPRKAPRRFGRPIPFLPQEMM